ncbi:MAG: guanylate kinase [Oscillospiraceae bacterium]|nr:guanylate kinase [Oscillospiraceae bacterium]
MSKGLLIVVSAPSGCGKGTLLEEAAKQTDFYYSVSATTRAPREGEKDGVNYHFLTRERFMEIADGGGMLEYAEYCGNLYGTPKKAVDDMLASGRDVLLEIEVQGALKVMEKCPEAVFIFILPPSLETLRERLEKRGTESAEVIAERVSQAEREIKEAYKYGYAVVNDELDKAVGDFLAIIRGEKLAVKRNGEAIDRVMGG